MFIALYLQGKFGPSKSSVVMALKSWWRPSFTFSVTGMQAVQDFAPFVFFTRERSIYTQIHESVQKMVLFSFFDQVYLI